MYGAAFEKQQWKTGCQLMGEKSEAKPTKETSWLVFITGHLIKGGDADEAFLLKVQEASCS